MRYLLLVFIGSLSTVSTAQQMKGKVYAEGNPLPMAAVYIPDLGKGTETNDNGEFILEGIPFGKYKLQISLVGFTTLVQAIDWNGASTPFEFELFPDTNLDPVVLSGTLRPVLRSESAIPVETYTQAFLKLTPTASIFEAMQQANGVRPQINCNLCNTGDIHINGLEGPYTMVLIDGMPIVSGLSTVYGLSGIPNGMIERVEVVKGPASSLYGSEAVGGLINIITKDAELAPEWYADSYYTGWGEWNTELGNVSLVGKHKVLTGVNHFLYDTPVDDNGDGFTDLALQHRASVFQKWQFYRSSGKAMSLAGRFVYEDRWGGETRWTPANRGGEEVYGESIYTRRGELLGSYELPVDVPLFWSFSGSLHEQDAAYGNTPYKATQRIAFSQLYTAQTLGSNEFLSGLAIRHTYYDDNTPATAEGADVVTIPGVFAQNAWNISEKHQLLTGLRWDYDRRHGSIWTPRLAYRIKWDQGSSLRFNAGTGFRVVNLFTEDHAALTGAREVVIEEDLDPEESYNANINFLHTWKTKSGISWEVDASAWYTLFTNAIIPDYDTNPDEIRYANLDGSLHSRGVSLGINGSGWLGLRWQTGLTLMDVEQRDPGGIRERPVLTERVQGNWAITYEGPGRKFKADYTGTLYGPMRLVLAGPLDPRDEFSPWWSLQDLQVSWKLSTQLEFYTGIRNLWDWTPARDAAFLIAGANDPFDRNVQTGPDGEVVPSPGNPYALTFDPTYVYASNQGRRWFGGLRFTFL